MRAGLKKVLEQIEIERSAQDHKFGEQNHPNGTGYSWFRVEAGVVRNACNSAFKMGNGTWQHVLAEEVCEAFAESDEVKLREELVQVAAVAAAWIECIDRKGQQ